jgi:hypothetical protein
MREVRAAPNRAMVADKWVSPWRGGGGRNSNGGGRKCDEDHGGSIACVDERCRGRGQLRRECSTRAWMRGTGRKRGTAATDAFYGGPVARAERKKGRGPVAGAPHGAVRPWALALIVGQHPGRPRPTQVVHSVRVGEGGGRLLARGPDRQRERVGGERRVGQHRKETGWAEPG